jgi:hypothetical protein
VKTLSFKKVKNYKKNHVAIYANTQHCWQHGFRKVAVYLSYDTARYADLVVSIEVAVELCYCFTVFSC